MLLMILNDIFPTLTMLIILFILNILQESTKGPQTGPKPVFLPYIGTYNQHKILI